MQGALGGEARRERSGRGGEGGMSAIACGLDDGAVV
jgi:hypothetical protein